MDRTSDIRVKFCGLTRLDDAIAAVEAGVNLLGFNFYDRSPRYITPETCASLVSALRTELGDALQKVQFVGVFVNRPPIMVSSLLEQCGLDLAQLSGDEPPDDLKLLGARAFKVIRAFEGKTLEQIGANLPRRARPPALLIDATSPGLYGGSGRTTDWEQARELGKRMPILLAGGLTPTNVTQAIYQASPWGVDVASGIEISPGKKDHAKMKDFVQAVRA